MKLLPRSGLRPSVWGFYRRRNGVQRGCGEGSRQIRTTQSTGLSGGFCRFRTEFPLSPERQKPKIPDTNQSHPRDPKPPENPASS